MPSEAVILSHAGRQHSYRTAAALDAAGMLCRFVTSGYYRRDRFPDRLAASVPRLDGWLRARHQEGLDSRRVTRFPRLELPEIAYRRCFGDTERAARIVRWRDAAFDRLVSRRLPAWGGRLFWGFQGSCRSSLAVARDLGMKTVIEFPGIPDAVARALLGAAPGVAEAGPGIEQADVWVAASSFSARCLEQAGAPAGRIRLIPLGVEPARFPFRPRAQRGPLKVLFVGKLAPHKGIGDLFAAMRKLDATRVTLTLVGPEVGEAGLVLARGAAHRFTGPLHGEALTRAMHEHDVLALPSLYEGFGLVILEAMASGMPVIASENSCAPDVIRPGVDGFVVAARDPDAMAARLDWCAGNRSALGEMGAAASARAGEFTWQRYGERVGAFARDLLGEAGA